MHGNTGWRRWVSVALIALALCVAGCAGGATGGSSGTGAQSSPTPRSSPTPGKAVACAGGALPGGSAPSVTLRASDASHEATVPVGAVVEFRLESGHVWHLGAITPRGALTPVGSQGALEQGDCVWDFQVAQAGEGVVTFTGSALCQPGQMCPQYALLVTFTVHGA